MPKPPHDRGQYYRQVFLKTGWLVVLALWSVLSNADTIAEKIIKPSVSSETWAKLQGYFVTTSWPWYGWLLGAMAIVLLGAVETGYRLHKAERDRVLTLEREREPRLAILWRPGEETFFFQYPSGMVQSTHYRICVVNTSTTAVNGIRVTLETLTPHQLPCVPCCLRLMNNILPAADPPIEIFSLNPGARQFIDLMEQTPGRPAFNIWHTVVPQIPTQVPAQPYSLTIRATAANAPAVSQDLEIFQDGPLWNLRLT